MSDLQVLWIFLDFKKQSIHISHVTCFFKYVSGVDNCGNFVTTLVGHASHLREKFISLILHMDHTVPLTYLAYGSYFSSRNLFGE